MSTEPTERTDTLVPRELATINAEVVKATMDTLKTIRQFVASELRDGTDFGTIPGTGTKKVMLLPGAQKVCMLYNCYPRYEVRTMELGNGHVEFQVVTELVNRVTETVVGSGIGSCSTMESKYRYRGGSRLCPQCQKATIKKSKYPPRNNPHGEPGFYCYSKMGGCGAEFAADDRSIVSQSEERQENPDIYDCRNTVLKMAKKRSSVDASIGLGCLTELFTQDLDENIPDAPEPHPPERDRGNAKDAELAASIQEWQDALSVMPSLNAFNGMLPDLKPLPESLRKRVWGLFQAHAEHRGWEWDKEAVAFNVKQTVPDSTDDDFVPF